MTPLVRERRGPARVPQKWCLEATVTDFTAFWPQNTINLTVLLNKSLAKTNVSDKGSLFVVVGAQSLHQVACVGLSCVKLLLSLAVVSCYGGCSGSVAC